MEYRVLGRRPITRLRGLEPLSFLPAFLALNYDDVAVPLEDVAARLTVRFGSQKLGWGFRRVRLRRRARGRARARGRSEMTDANDAQHATCGRRVP